MDAVNLALLKKVGHAKAVLLPKKINAKIFAEMV